MLLVGLLIAAAYIRKVYQTFMADRDNYKKMEGRDLWYPPYRLP